MTESAPHAVKLTFGYKVIWGIASLGTSLIAGVFARKKAEYERRKA